MSRATTSKAPTAPATTGQRVTLWMLRLLALVTSAAVAAQPLLAGVYLDGNVKAILVHGVNGHSVSGLIFLQVIASLIFWIVGRGRGWPLHASVVLLFAATMQIGFGYGGYLALHVTLGVAILACQLGVTVWVCTPAASRPRQRRGRNREVQQNQEQESHA